MTMHAGIGAIDRPASQKLRPVEDLVDPICGVVKRISDFPAMTGLPRNFVSCVASVSDTRQFAVWLADRISAGTSFGDRRAAWMAALGEGVERYCGNNIPLDLERGTAAALRAAGHHVVGAGQLASFSVEQHQQPGFAYQRFTDTMEVLWARGFSPEREPVLVPGSWVYLNWHQGSRRNEPRTNHLNYAGIATGAGLADAAERALAECIERDAVVAWWLLGLPAISVDPFSIEGFRDDWAGCPFQVTLVSLPSEFGLPVLGALIFDNDAKIPAAGFSSHPDPQHAGRKAIQEALQVWIATSGLTAADGASFQAVAAGAFSPKSYLPYRADRRYLDDVGENFCNIKDLAAQTQLWLDDRLHPMLERFRGDGRRPVDIASLPPGDTQEFQEALHRDNFHPVTIDLTTADVAQTPLAVARVIVPGLLPNAPAAYPYLGTQRLTEIALSHGRSGFRPKLANVTLTPPPHN
ncbi:hypothetical protein EH165_13265 [Nakamurella antarctica]|uniref:YcaO domain-containing protein n=1 Tax=Nakamurella antarctica TaxID=1902245 RepID=A0A3G8ZNU9_9ACTN|nr:YcaO-like family protein [Nakamurella antarctica]AZI58969.1 hypothetical protein EH165_13265 [Nakamurella antarctica]